MNGDRVICVSAPAPDGELYMLVEPAWEYEKYLEAQWLFSWEDG